MDNAPAFDIIIKQDFLDKVCTCRKCTEMFELLRKTIVAMEVRDEDAANLEKNLNGDVNPELPVSAP
jgi:hypothetical protein